MSSLQQPQNEWNQCLCSLMPRMIRVCGIHSSFQLSQVSKALRGAYQELLPISHYKFNQDAEDKDIYTLLHASSFQKKVGVKCSSDDAGIGEENVAKKPKVNDSRSSTNDTNLTVDLNSNFLNLNSTKLLSLPKNIKISNGTIRSDANSSSGIKIIDSNVKFSKIEFITPLKFLSHGKPEINIENSCFEFAEFFPMSKGTIIQISNSKVVGKLVVRTTQEANIHIETCQAQLPNGSMAMENGMFHVSNCHIQNLRLKMY